MFIKNSSYLIILCGLAIFSCTDSLEDPLENVVISQEVDYSDENSMSSFMIGAYEGIYRRGWEDALFVAVRGDDVNAGGLGDQPDFAAMDNFNYNKAFWMSNQVWKNYYTDIYQAESAIEQIQLFKEQVSNKALADQYIAEAKVFKGYLLLQLARMWDQILLPPSSKPEDLFTVDLSTKQEAMEYISDLMDESIGNLPDLHPSERSDIKGGVTRYTALAVKALANLELKNWDAVTQSTGEIIQSGRFVLEPDYYELFKVNKGKLNKENIFEFQYSDFGTASGEAKNYLMAPFGPSSWTPKVEGARGGWGFFEPSVKYIKFMLDRGEEDRLVTSVNFTPRGIEEIQKDPNYATLPDFISNVTRSGDTFNDYVRAMYGSGKHYLPSDQLTPGRTAYGSNKNMVVIRFAEILLVHAEAMVNGASSSVLSSTEAVNLVRERAGLEPLSAVTLDDVLAEKYAELAMEWGNRYFDLIRYERYGELSYDGRTFDPAEDVYIPYPTEQVDLLPALEE